MIYMRTTPKYVLLYETLNMDEIRRWKPGMKYRKPKIGCVKINRITQIIIDRHVSTIEIDDVNKFLDRNHPIEQVKEGMDLVAKLMLRYGSVL